MSHPTLHHRLLRSGVYALALIVAADISMLSVHAAEPEDGSAPCTLPTKEIQHQLEHAYHAFAQKRDEAQQASESDGS